MPPKFHNHLLVNAARITRRSGRSPGSFEHGSGHPDIRDHWARMLEFFILLHFYVHKTIDTAKAKVNLVTRLAEHHTRKVKEVVIRVGVWCNLSARRIMGNVFDID